MLSRETKTLALSADWRLEELPSLRFPLSAQVTLFFRESSGADERREVSALLLFFLFMLFRDRRPPLSFEGEAEGEGDLRVSPPPLSAEAIESLLAKLLFDP